MIQLRLEGDTEEIITQLQRIRPGLAEDWKAVYGSISHYTKREVLNHEGMALFLLAEALQPNAVFEIGTAWGNTAVLMAAASPASQVFTCTANPNHAKIATRNVKAYRNVTVIHSKSQELLPNAERVWDMIFVDGDHDAVATDLPWWNALRVGGLMLFHDYSPVDSNRPCRRVYETLNKFEQWLGRKPEVSIIETSGIGMVGWYRRTGDPDWV